jgi:hypothetical protein
MDENFPDMLIIFEEIFKSMINKINKSHSYPIVPLTLDHRVSISFLELYFEDIVYQVSVTHTGLSHELSHLRADSLSIPIELQSPEPLHRPRNLKILEQRQDIGHLSKHNFSILQRQIIERSVDNSPRYVLLDAEALTTGCACPGVYFWDNMTVFRVCKSLSSKFCESNFILNTVDVVCPSYWISIR